MRKCPVCGSINIRNSRHHVHGRSLRTLLTAWYRCRDCGSRFLRVDPVRQAAFGAVALGIAALGVWATFGTASPTEPDAARATPAAAGKSTWSVFWDGPARDDSGGPFSDSVYPSHPLAEGNDLDTRERARQLRDAADGGDVRAQLELGILCEAGRGVIQDFVEAAKWFRKAAEQGEPEAMLHLGRMAEMGRGMPKDLSEAYVWLNLAAARGEVRAEAARERVRALLTPERIAEAQERSRLLDHKIASR